MLHSHSDQISSTLIRDAWWPSLGSGSTGACPSAVLAERAPSQTPREQQRTWNWDFIHKSKSKGQDTFSVPLGKQHVWTVKPLHPQKGGMVLTDSLVAGFGCALLRCSPGHCLGRALSCRCLEPRRERAPAQRSGDSQPLRSGSGHRPRGRTFM